MEKNVIILGAGISGITAALEVSKSGVPVILVEKEKNIGGLPTKFTCKAVEKCALCGLCQFNSVIYELNENKNIKVLVNSELKKIEKNNGSFIATVLQKTVNEDGKEKLDSLEIPAISIIVATGADIYDARRKAQFGYKRFKNVITGLELENKLRSGSKDIFSGKIPKEVAFIQCVGSRDENIKNGYCSKICCRYALRMANVLKENYNCNITIFYMDMQTTGKDIFLFYQDVKGKFEFINSIPAYIKEKDEMLEVRYDNILSGKMGYKNFDLVVLSVGFSANRENIALSDILGVNLDRFGFFETGNNFATNVEGIFSIGTSSAPMGIVEAESSAKVVAYEIISKLGGKQ